MIPPFIHAEPWSPGRRFASWPLLRAYEITDGVRGWWDGEALWSRSGNKIDAPWKLPKGVTLDGEIVGLDPSAVSGAVSAGSKDARWKELRFSVVDLPNEKGDFDQRRALLEKKKLPKCCEVVEVRRVPSEAALEAFRREVEGRGGRGLMLRLGSGDSNAQVWKLRVSPEFEATKIAQENGSGKNADRVGVLICVTTSGQKFRVAAGLTDAVRDNPPADGTVVICRCSALTSKGNPKSPVFVRVRGSGEEGAAAPAPAAKPSSKRSAGKGEKVARIAAGELGLIYLASFENGRRYVGMTMKTLKRRVSGHLYDARREETPFHRAILKNGNPKWRTICRAPFSALPMLETTAICWLGTHGTEGGLNATWGGDHPCGQKRPDLAARNKARRWQGATDAEVIAMWRGGKTLQIADGFDGVSIKVPYNILRRNNVDMSAERNKRAGKSRVGQKHSAETIAKLRRIKRSPETIAKLRVAALAREARKRNLREIHFAAAA